MGTGYAGLSSTGLDLYLNLQQRAASEETSENTHLQSAFATEGASLPSLDYSTPINYGMPQVSMLPSCSSSNSNSSNCCWPTGVVCLYT